MPPLRLYFARRFRFRGAVELITTPPATTTARKIASNTPATNTPFDASNAICYAREIKTGQKTLPDGRPVPAF